MKKIWLLLFLLVILTGCTSETKNNLQEYTDSMKKCTVMEAVDLYSQQSTTENVFDKGRETCETIYNQLGNDDFIETIKIDWENRKNEEIDGKKLEYYLDIIEL